MHKKDKKRFLNILLVPDNQEAPPKNFRIRYTTLNFLVFFLGISLISVVFGIVTYSRVLQMALEKGERENELNQLRDQLRVSYQLQAELDTIKAYRERVRNSLQGYIKFADRAPDQSLVIEKSVDNAPFKTTIFTHIPTKMPIQEEFVSQEFDWPAHPGIDLVAQEGVPIQAAGDGTVIFSGWSFERGNVVILYHPGGFVTQYFHNARNVVVVNQRVKQGEVIAYVGNSGESSSGPHLHFEIWKNGQPLNPRLFLLDLKH